MIVTVKLVCQCFLALFVAFRLISYVVMSLKGRPREEPSGLSGVLGSILGTAILVLMHLYAGSFSLFGGPQ